MNPEASLGLRNAQRLPVEYFISDLGFFYFIFTIFFIQFERLIGTSETLVTPVGTDDGRMDLSGHANTK